MFADPANPDGSDNAYKAAVDAINAAVTALDAKVKPTNAAAVADLKATLQAQEGTEYFDFVNYDYDVLLATTIIESGIDGSLGSTALGASSIRRTLRRVRRRPQCAILISSMPSIWWSCSTPA